MMRRSYVKSFLVVGLDLFVLCSQYPGCLWQRKKPGYTPIKSLGNIQVPAQEPIALMYKYTFLSIMYVS